MRKAGLASLSEVGAECCLCMSTVCVHQPSCHVPLAGGALATEKVWERLAVDITHVNGRPYLSTIDRASRFTIWRRLKDESAKEVTNHLTSIFAEMGLPEFLLLDNEAVFCSIEVRWLLEAWDVAADFSCAYRSQGNSIIERVHRTIKQMVARSGRCAEQMTFWYNATAGECIASLFEMVFAAKPKMPGVTGERWEVDRDWPEPQAREKNDT